MFYLWIGLAVWFAPAVILGVILTWVVVKDKIVTSRSTGAHRRERATGRHRKPYHHSMTWFLLSLLVALGTLSAYILMNS